MEKGEERKRATGSREVIRKEHEEGVNLGERFSDTSEAWANGWDSLEDDISEATGWANVDKTLVEYARQTRDFLDDLNDLVNGRTQKIPSDMAGYISSRLRDLMKGWETPAHKRERKFAIHWTTEVTAKSHEEAAKLAYSEAQNYRGFLLSVDDGLLPRRVVKQPVDDFSSQGGAA